MLQCCGGIRLEGTAQTTAVLLRCGASKWWAGWWCDLNWQAAHAVHVDCATLCWQMDSAQRTVMVQVTAVGTAPKLPAWVLTPVKPVGGRHTPSKPGKLQVTVHVFFHSSPCTGAQACELVSAAA